MTGTTIDDIGFKTGNQILDSLTTNGQKELLQKYSFNRTYRNKEILFYSFHLADYAYVIRSGKVRLWKQGANGHDHIIGFANSGELVGCRGCINHTHYSLSATAVEDSEICVIPKEIFNRLIEENDSLNIQVLRYYIQKLEDLEIRLGNMVDMNAREKIADVFILIGNEFGYKQNSTTLKLKLSRGDIASFAGISKDSVVKQLSKFRRDKIINYKGKSISILKLDKLQHIIESFNGKDH